MADTASSGRERRRPKTKDARRRRLIRAAQVAIAVAVVAGIFVGVIPRIASYSAVWRTLSRLDGGELAALVGITLFNIATYWPQMVAAMPGLTLAQAAVNNQTSTAIANTVPGGGAVAVGLAVGQLRSWGFSNSDIALMALLTGVWNTLIKLAMPVVALAILAAQGDVGRGLVFAAVVGVVALVVSISVLALILWRESFARKLGSMAATAVSFVRKLVRKPPLTGWGRAAVRFRRDTIDVVTRRWAALTVTTIVSHVGLYLVLLISIRDVGIGASTVTWAEALGVFAFARLVSAVPITPGGVGVVELSYIGGLVLVGAHRPEAVAASLLFRALTYFLQIPLGAVAFVVWQRKKDWRTGDTKGVNGSATTSRQPSKVRA